MANRTRPLLMVSISEPVKTRFVSALTRRYEPGSMFSPRRQRMPRIVILVIRGVVRLARPDFFISDFLSLAKEVNNQAHDFRRLQALAFR